MPSTRRSGGVGGSLQGAWEDGPSVLGHTVKVLASVLSYSLGPQSWDALWALDKGLD